MELNGKNVETPPVHTYIEEERSLQKKISRIVMRTKDRFIALVTVDNANMLPWFYKWIPAAVLAVSFTATGVHYKREQELLIKDLQAECASGTSDIEKQIVQNIQSYEQVMLGMKGLFEQEQPVTKEVFENYVSNLDLEKNFYGVQEVQFTALERENEKKKYKQWAQHDRLLGNRMPPEEKREYNLQSLYSKSFGKVIYDGKTEKDIFGLDLALDHINPQLHNSFLTTQNRAMEQARDTGKMTISDITNATTLSTQDIQERYFHIYMPIYRYNTSLNTTLDRQKQIIGYIDTSFSVSKFIEKIIPKNKNIDVKLYDANQLLLENQFYESPDLNRYSPIFTTVESINVG